MDTSIAIAVVSPAVAVVGSAILFFLTKRKEREADQQRNRFEFYREFINALSGTVGNDSTPDGQRAFTKACNILSLLAPQRVLNALYEFRSEISVNNLSRSEDRHDELLTKLILEIRRELGIRSDFDRKFRIRLWTSSSEPQDYV